MKSFDLKLSYTCYLYTLYKKKKKKHRKRALISAPRNVTNLDFISPQITSVSLEMPQSVWFI